MENIKTLNDYIIIEPIEEATRSTESGLELTIEQLGDIRYLRGRVAYESPLEELKIGDEVLYDKVAGHYMDINGKQLKVLRLRDIVVVF